LLFGVWCGGGDSESDVCVCVCVCVCVESIFTSFAVKESSTLCLAKRCLAKRNAVFVRPRVCVCWRSCCLLFGVRCGGGESDVCVCVCVCVCVWSPYSLPVHKIN